jgi:hypothetical protein
MRVMLDNSVFGHSQICEWATGPQGTHFGIDNQHYEVAGIVRKKPHNDAAFQAQIDSLLTIGRLIREKQVEAYTYSELRCESMQRFIGDRMLDALAECQIKTCPPALERSRFLWGNGLAFARKGGKKDRKRGLSTGLSQIAFLQMLCELREGFLPLWMPLKELIGLTDFEIESLNNLKCFQMLCKFSNSTEHYPDMFHLWTAQRNRMNVFLTLDNKLANIAKTIRKSGDVPIEFPTEVLRPLELLDILGINKPDPVPIQYARFYPLLELWRDAPSERFALFRVSLR